MTSRTIADLLKGVVTVIALGVSVWLTAGVLRNLRPPETTAQVQEELRKATESIAREQASSNRELKELRAQYAAIQSAVQAGAAPTAASGELRLSLDRVENRLRQLEKIILDTPDKALECYILRAEIQQLKTTSQETEQRVSRDIERVYDLSKWLLGTGAIGALSFFLVSLIGRFFGARKD